MSKFIQVHRFRDLVATHAANGATIYLTAKEARAWARHLNAAAREITAGVAFGKSQVGTKQIEIPVAALTSYRAESDK